MQYNTIQVWGPDWALYSPQVPRDMGCFVRYATVMQVKGVGSNEGSVNKKNHERRMVVRCPGICISLIY